MFSFVAVTATGYPIFFAVTSSGITSPRTAIASIPCESIPWCMVSSSLSEGYPSIILPAILWNIEAASKWFYIVSPATSVKKHQRRYMSCVLPTTWTMTHGKQCTSVAVRSIRGIRKLTLSPTTNFLLCAFRFIRSAFLSQLFRVQVYAY